MGNAAPAATAERSALLEIETVGAVMTVGLNRPAKRNALNDGIILAIQDCFSDLPEGVGAVVIHGIGDHFSSGLDLSELTEHDATEGLRHSQMWHRVFDRIQYSRVPVIAALKGRGDRRRAGVRLRGAYPGRRALGSISRCPRASVAFSSVAADRCGYRG